ncbi:MULTISPECIES: MarR family transcriptional regulator [unclassified Streptomyces]|uniref:MarR family transcriptional regulator n=1 Tax=unclassified Streptomyces TaxID=2593676 RepID=UPI002ED2904B|nr:MarR family transcriptional regulator [Streptomyces sp. NBC_00891]WSY05971.1 MarR family transcriptional regulator [Streptomyces sp. NBC_00890]WSZ07595.1 MarR family transcriptional regulator [Streptomyces sp. NBC_00869]WSZ24906.1 MarR family transcriptional regulator [Streptomyces sp. NBC_00870]
MATQNLSPALPTSARSAPYPKASPGYGKRAVPDQRPPTADDFAFLPERERYIAGYVDRLPDGAAMSIKSLAKCQPLYGQMAVGSALRALAVAGHLRQVRCAVDGSEGIRWVTRTFWSRTARDNEWWNAFLAAEESRCAPQPAVAPVGPPPWVPAEPAAAEAPAPAPVLPKQRAGQPQGPSPAYLALAELGRTDARLALSAADCAVLEQLAAQWFARGVDADYLTRALTAGLPEAVDSPVGFVRRRLRDKLPPQLPAAQGAPARRLMVECADCGAYGKPEVFRDGLCGPCLRSAQSGPAADPVPEEDSGAGCDVQGHVRRLREQLRAR